LASDVGGHHELIEHGKTGWLFKKDNVADLTKQIVDILLQLQPGEDLLPDQFVRIQQQALAFVRHQRTWRNSVANYQQVYPQALASL
jgi:glycosyltransferase involved in cell wall biosynthesis